MPKSAFFIGTASGATVCCLELGAIDPSDDIRAPSGQVSSRGRWSGQMSDNLYEFLSRGFPADRSKPCFILSDGREISYGELERGAACVAGRLLAEGAAPGDRIAMQVEKSVEAVMIYLGVLKAGTV